VAPYVVILRRIDGQPVTVVSQDVQAINTLISSGGRNIGSTVHIRGGPALEVSGDVLEVTTKVFPPWLMGLWGAPLPPTSGT
jgi:hypothetical protein